MLTGPWCTSLIANPNNTDGRMAMLLRNVYWIVSLLPAAAS